MTCTAAPRRASEAISPPHPSTSSSACGARTRTLPGSSDSSTSGSHVAALSVVVGGLQDQRVEVELRPPPQLRGEAEDRNLVERLGFLVERAVDGPSVHPDDRRAAPEQLLDQLGQP